MIEVAIKSHLIITDIHEEYEINWHGKIKDTKPIIQNGYPIFVIISNRGRVELNTLDIKWIEDTAKNITCPKGRKAISTDAANIYIKEIGGKETCVGTVVHKRVKKFAPMYDKVFYN